LRNALISSVLQVRIRLPAVINLHKENILSTNAYRKQFKFQFPLTIRTLLRLTRGLSACGGIFYVTVPVRPSVCLFVILTNGVETAKHSTKNQPPHETTACDKIPLTSSIYMLETYVSKFPSFQVRLFKLLYLRK